MALACYGLMRDDCHRVMLRFVEGSPVSEMTIAFLDLVRNQLGREGRKALLMDWYNASWHISQRVKGWIREGNLTAKG